MENNEQQPPNNEEVLLKKYEENISFRKIAIKTVIKYNILFSHKNNNKKEFQKNKKIIDLSYFEFDDIDACSISDNLKENSQNIQVFQIANTYITDIGLINVLSNLQWCSNIREIHLGNNLNLTEISLNAFIETLPIFKHLRILGMCNCGLVDENIINFSYILEVYLNFE